MRIRRAVDDDARAVAVVHVRSWKAAFPGLVPQLYLDALEPEHRLAQWEETLAATAWPRAGTFVVTAGPDEVVAGFVSLGPTRDPDADPDVIGEVMTIYLDPPLWGSGVGGRLLEAALSEMRAAAFRRATLWTLGTNSRARRFYERRGWAADGATKEHDWGAFVATDVRYGRHL